MSKQEFKKIVQAFLSLVVNATEAENCNTNELKKSVLSSAAYNVCFYKVSLLGHELKDKLLFLLWFPRITEYI